MEEIKLHQFAEKLELQAYSKRCIAEYPRIVGRFFGYLDEKESVATLAEVTPEHLKAYQAWVRFGHLKDGKPLTTGGVCTRLAALKTFFRLMHREGLIERDLSEHIALPKYHPHLPRNVPTQAQVRALLAAADEETPLGIRDRAIVELLYATGMRSEELRTLTLDDWDESANTLFITGKGSKDRVVPAGAWMPPFLRRYLAAARPRLAAPGVNLFFLSKNGRMIARANLSWLVRRYAAKAGLRGVTTHSVRHACATHLLENGADIRYIQELLGHCKLSTTQIYTKVDIGLLKQAHRRFHPREREEG